MTIKERLEQIEDNKAPAEHILHQMLELAMAVTGEGYVSDDYTKFIEFQIGEATIFSDPYYQQVKIDDSELSHEQVRQLTKEVKKRILAFDKKTQSMRNKAANEIFEKPLPDVGL